MPTWKQLAKWKWQASNAESFREFGHWYHNKWKKDYPDLVTTDMGRYNYRSAFRARARAPRRLMVTGRSKRRKKQYAKRKKSLVWKKPLPARLQVGEPVGFATCKSTVTIDTTHDNPLPRITEDTLVATTPINNLAIASVSNAINERQRDIVNCRGFKIDIYVVNNNQDRLYQFNWAIISPKEQDSGDTLTAEFFRAYDATRSINFNATTNTGMELTSSPINTDAYTVFVHRRCYLMPNKFGTMSVDYKTSDDRPGFKKLSYYLPLNRQLRYKSSESNCEEPMYLVYWMTHPFKLSTVTGGLQVGTISHRIVMYWKEPKN
jgi:hypothetical protein